MNLIKLVLSEPTDTNRSDRVTNTHKMRDVNGACMPVHLLCTVLIGPCMPILSLYTQIPPQRHYFDFSNKVTLE